MTAHMPFSVPAPWPFGVQLGVVINVQDPAGLSRVQITLLAADPARAAPVWARVAVPVAGAKKGAFLIPDVGDEVLVAFVGGDSRAPVVVGALWNGAQTPSETLGGKGDKVDRWSFTGRNGTRIAIVEETSGQETISFTTPSGVTGTLTDASGGKIELKTSNATVTLDTGGVTITTPSEVKVKAGSKLSVQAGQVEVKAGQVKIDSALVNCTGVVKCAVLQTSSVVSTSYTPGAGNVW